VLLLLLLMVVRGDKRVAFLYRNAKGKERGEKIQEKQIPTEVKKKAGFEICLFLKRRMDWVLALEEPNRSSACFKQGKKDTFIVCKWIVHLQTFYSCESPSTFYQLL
jgi:hypothetical protein